MAQARLDSLPTEIIEAIVTHLTLLDVCLLRLTAREVAAKSSQGCFKVHFITKTVHLSSLKELELFVQVTEDGWQGCALQHLKVVGPNLSADQTNETGEGQNRTTADLLAKALTNLRLHSSHGRLGSLTLSIDRPAQNRPRTVAIPFYHWQPVWKSAGQTFRIVAHALQVALILVEKLDVFGDVDRCSLSPDRFRPVLDHVDLSVPLQALKDLSLSVSQREARDSEDQMSTSSTHPNGKLSTSLSRFLKQCPNLERLHFSWYNLRLTDLTTAEQEDRRFFDHAVGPGALSLLREITLEGIYTCEEALLSFLDKRRDLRIITFKELHLESGTFRPVFDHMVDHLNHLDSVHFDDLWESRLIQFPSAPGKPHFPHPGGPTWIVRKGVEARQSIKYQPIKGRIKGSPNVNIWHRQKTILYGPP